MSKRRPSRYFFPARGCNGAVFTKLPAPLVMVVNRLLVLTSERFWPSFGVRVVCVHWKLWSRQFFAQNVSISGFFWFSHNCPTCRHSFLWAAKSRTSWQRELKVTAAWVRSSPPFWTVQIGPNVFSQKRLMKPWNTQTHVRVTAEF